MNSFVRLALCALPVFVVACAGEATDEEGDLVGSDTAAITVSGETWFQSPSGNNFCHFDGKKTVTCGRMQVKEVNGELQLATGPGGAPIDDPTLGYQVNADGTQAKKLATLPAHMKGGGGINNHGRRIAYSQVFDFGNDLWCSAAEKTVASHDFRRSTPDGKIHLGITCHNGLDVGFVQNIQGGGTFKGPSWGNEGGDWQPSH